MPEAELIDLSSRQKRTRKRKDAFSAEQRREIAERVCKFYDDDRNERSEDIQLRLQRYAKYRMWSQGTDSPWPDASDVAIPDMMQDSLRIQDTLHNAVMSQRPPIISKAFHKTDAEKQSTVDALIDYQFFVEQDGETIIGEMAEAFVNDPACIVFVPWITETRGICDIRRFDPIPETTEVSGYFYDLTRQQFNSAVSFAPKGKSDWDWLVELEDGTEQTVSFYTLDNGDVEMVIEKDEVVFDGPKIIVKDYDDVLFPARSANLQLPGPSNPNGATHVILRDRPTLSELKRLSKSKFYDLLSKQETDELGLSTSNDDTDAELQIDNLQGVHPITRNDESPAHNRFTRLVCFDSYDIDNDGIDEDVIFWVIKETKTLLKAKRLTDAYPANPPRRPLAGGSFLPVSGRFSGISLLELEENLHDVQKVLMDQSINANDLAIASPGFYRPSGGMNPEVLRIEPYTLSPLQNPQQDVNFPQFNNQQSLGFALNMLGLLNGWQDRLSMVSDMQFGKVQPGGSSAMRTSSNMALLAGQGEARPERILRRFFKIIAEVWAQIHELNQRFLPKDKQIRISGMKNLNDDPYQTISDAGQIRGRYQFDFSANVLNTSKIAMQQGLRELMATYINPLTLQLGLLTPETAYQLLRDFGKSVGQEPDRYLQAPSPESSQPKILAEEAITAIMNETMPVGLPMEQGGAQEHLQKLEAYMQSDEFGHLSDNGVMIFKEYYQQTQQRVQAEMQQQAMMQAVQQFAQQQQGGQGGQPGAPVQNPPQLPGQPQISGPNELMNESLPGAGGGANSA